MLKYLTVWLKTNWKILKENTRPPYLPLRNLNSVQEATVKTDMEQATGSKRGKECIKVAYCYPVYLTYMQNVC